MEKVSSVWGTFQEASNFITREEKLLTKTNTNLVSRLKGQLLLQVESHGEAWYLNPKDQMRYYLGTPAMSFSIMRNLGLGAKTSDISKIKVAPVNYDNGPDSDGDGLSDAFEDAIGSNKHKADSDGDGHDDKTEFLNGYNVLGAGKQDYNIDFTKKQHGKILLQVEGHGEAWYINPVTNMRYYLGKPADAYHLMRTLSLGISNENIRKIPIGRVK